MKATLRFVSVLFVTMALAAGCGDDDDTSTTGTTVTTDDGVSTTVTSDSGSTTTSVVDDVELLVVLTPDGVGFTTADSGSISRVDFESDQELVVDTITKSLDSPVEEGPQDECPAGPAEQARWSDITVTFQEGKFVGWSLGPSSTLTTVDGIGLGTTLAELRDAFADVETIDSTLGVEATAGGYTFVLSDDTDDATVDAMLAGTNCVFR